jgi:glycerophosphoryl diester phosphodiesterase
VVDAVHMVGRAVFVWGLPSPRCIGRVVSAGVDGVITDFPDVVKKKLGGSAMPATDCGQT